MTFDAIYAEGFGLPSSLSEGIAVNNQVLYKKPGWHFFLAKEDDAPIGVGVYYQQGKTAVLAAAATLPQYRGRGCHSALINWRMAQALQDHCDLVVGQAAFASTCMRNMQKMGMEIAYTKAIWTQLKSKR
ncbi:GNAT family N-acetyltransferase [Gracilibacillus timonensis]|uniref:GNAT family N-acetyltransferase n=1 Tax=Gracilibacillus timonensis TaxID=1816696 RepID=UPI000825DB4A|nr:GNAT family N-acetyltransferase [Gracilibacillus timonensis]